MQKEFSTQISKAEKHTYTKLAKNIMSSKKRWSNMMEVLKWNHCEYCDIPTICKKTEDLYIELWYTPSQAKEWSARTKFSKVCPSCGAYVGCHLQGRVAKWRVANKPLRLKKTEAHKYFDYLWRVKVHSFWGDKVEIRKKAYTWLSAQMGTPEKLTHIGMFSERQCQRVIDICKPLALSLESKSNLKIWQYS